MGSVVRGPCPSWPEQQKSVVARKEEARVEFVGKRKKQEAGRSKGALDGYRWPAGSGARNENRVDRIA